FRMLLWKLCYEKILYENHKPEDIKKHVLSSKRENLTIGNRKQPKDKEIQKEFVRIIKKIAQLNYAFTLIKDIKDPEKQKEFLKYLKLLADQGNEEAEYHL
ncbi:12065_t:CDS:2, partial [Racocetra persica]